jgi:hypothetical protein
MPLERPSHPVTLTTIISQKHTSQQDSIYNCYSQLYHSQVTCLSFIVMLNFNFCSTDLKYLNQIETTVQRHV